MTSANKKKKIAILISGRGSNMQAIINACAAGKINAEVTLVLSNKAEAQGLEFAKHKGLHTSVINHKNYKSREEFDKAMHEDIIKSGAEIICLAGFMRLLSPWFCQQWNNKMLNIHPSLLPEFKGAHAVRDALLAGAEISGCTVHFVSAEMDSGPIITQASVPVLAGDTVEILSARILEQEHKCYIEALQKII